MQGMDDRLLWVCLGLSVLLHATTLVFAPRVEPRVEPPPPRLTAKLRDAVPVAPAAPPAAAQPPVPEPPPAAEPPKPQVPPPPTQKSEPKPMPPAEPRLAKAPSETRPAEPRAAAAPSAPAPVQPAPAAPAAAPAPSAAPAAEARADAAPRAAAPAAPDVSDRDLVTQYQAQIAQIVETRKLKRYPNEAMQNGWEGVSTVLLRIGSDGKVAGVETATSSGHELLDEQARISISKAKPFVPIPEALRGKAFEARVRVVFSLKN